MKQEYNTLYYVKSKILRKDYIINNVCLFLYTNVDNHIMNMLQLNLIEEDIEKCYNGWFLLISVLSSVIKSSI